MSDTNDIRLLLYDPDRSRAYIKDSIETLGFNHFMRLPSIHEIDQFVHQQTEGTFVILSFDNTPWREQNELRLVKCTSSPQTIQLLEIRDEDFEYQNLGMLKDRIYNQIDAIVPSAKSTSPLLASIRKNLRAIIFWVLVTLASGPVAYAGMQIYSQLRGSIDSSQETGTLFLRSQNDSLSSDGNR